MLCAAIYEDTGKQNLAKTQLPPVTVNFGGHGVMGRWLNIILGCFSENVFGYNI
jgi:hypothetical protein